MSIEGINSNKWRHRKDFFFCTIPIICLGLKHINNLIESVVSISDSMYFFIWNYNTLQAEVLKILHRLLCLTSISCEKEVFTWNFVCALIFHKIILYALNIRLRWNFHLKSMQVLFSWEFYWTISVKIMWGEVFFFTTNRRCVISEH